MNTNLLSSWKILSSEYVFSTKWFRIRRDTVRLPNGQVYNEYYVKERSDWAAIFCLTEENQLLLLKTYKHGSQSVVFELPSGSIKGSETPEEGVKRELAEETGFSIPCGNLVQIGTVLVDPTYTQAKLHIFFGRGAKVNFKPEDNPMEMFEICLLPLETVDKTIWDNLDHFPESQIACIMLGLNYLRKQRMEL